MVQKDQLTPQRPNRVDEDDEGIDGNHTYIQALTRTYTQFVAESTVIHFPGPKVSVVRQLIGGVLKTKLATLALVQAD